MEFWLIFDVFRHDVITSLTDVNFLNFHNEQKCMIIGFNLMYIFYLSRRNQNFSRGYKLLHIFWNTLYMNENINSGFFLMKRKIDDYEIWYGSSAYGYLPC